MTTSTAASSVSKIASALAKADAAFELAIPTAGNGIAKILGENPTYETWEKVREEFISEYCKARKCVEKTANNRWGAIASYMADNRELEKPTKPTKAAEARAESRKKASVKVDAAKAQFTKSADAISEAHKLEQSGELEEAKIIRTAAEKLIKEEKKQAEKIARARLDNEKKLIKAALEKCTDEAVLKRVYELLAGNVPAELAPKAEAPTTKAAKPAKQSKPKKFNNAPANSPFAALGVLSIDQII